MAEPLVKGFFDKRTFSVQYVVADPQTGSCAIIDPVLDYDPNAGTIATWSADALLAHVREQGFRLEWILDTHPHADHLSAAGYLKDRTGAPTAIGDQVVVVQKLWKDIYNLPDTVPTDGSQWDRLFADGDAFRIGEIEAKAMLSPGHTPASVTYVIGDAAFIHDTLFMPDYGSARADFPGGDASTLWRSIQRILSLPAATRLFTGHDYMPGGREPQWESTVAEQKARNKHLQQASDEAAYVAMRNQVDSGLPLPRLLLQSLQVNIMGGRLPAPESNGRRYLKLPLDAFPKAVWS